MSDRVINLKGHRLRAKSIAEYFPCRDNNHYAVRVHTSHGTTVLLRCEDQEQQQRLMLLLDDVACGDTNMREIDWQGIPATYGIGNVYSMRSHA